MRTFILEKAYTILLGNSKSNYEKANYEKAKYLINLVGEFDKQQKEEEEKTLDVDTALKNCEFSEGFNIKGWDMSTVTDFSKVGAVVEERNVTKDISLDDFQKCFEGCTTFDADRFILENIQNYSLAELLEMFFRR